MPEPVLPVAKARIVADPGKVTVGVWIEATRNEVTITMDLAEAEAFLREFHRRLDDAKRLLGGDPAALVRMVVV